MMQTVTEAKPVPLVQIREVPSKPCLYIAAKKTMAEMPAFLQESYPKIYGHAKGQGEQCFSRYPSWNENEFEVEAGITTKESLLPEGDILAGKFGGHRALYTLHKGPYSGVTAAYDAIQGHLKEKEMKTAGAPYEVYLNDPSLVPEAELLTEVYWPIE